MKCWSRCPDLDLAELFLILLSERFHNKMNLSMKLNFNPLGGFGETSVSLYKKTLFSGKLTNPNEFCKSLSEWAPAHWEDSQGQSKIELSSEYYGVELDAYYCTTTATISFSLTRPICDKLKGDLYLLCLTHKSTEFIDGKFVLCACLQTFRALSLVDTCNNQFSLSVIKIHIIKKTLNISLKIHIYDRKSKKSKI